MPPRHGAQAVAAGEVRRRRPHGSRCARPSWPARSRNVPTRGSGGSTRGGTDRSRPVARADHRCRDRVGFASRCAVEGQVEPVLAPLPDVAGHVVQPEAIGWERVDRCRGDIAVGAGVGVREVPLEHVHPVLTARLEIVAPRERAPDPPAARGALPLGLGGQARAGPPAVRDRIAPRDMHDRVVASAVDPRLRTFGMAPVGTVHLPPPLGADHARGVRERLREQPHEHERPTEAFGIGAANRSRRRTGRTLRSSLRTGRCERRRA